MHSKNILLSIMVLQVATIGSIFFNVPFARQLLSFLFVTFVPGYLIIRICRFDNLRFSLTIFFSVAMSIFFLMLVGLLLNALLPFAGMPHPLSTLPILVSVNVFVLVSYAFLSIKDQAFPSIHIPFLKLLPGIILLLGLSSLTVIGVEMARLGNTLMLMVLVGLTSLIVMCIFSAKLIPKESYPLAIVAIALFLLFHVSLISNYVIGTDVHAETYFAQLALSNSYWNRTIFHPYNAMISVTILPVVYDRFLSVDTTSVYKIIYPLIYSFVPLILYVAYRKQVGSLWAFLSVFFFMSMDTFYVQMLGLARQMIGELFFALLVYLIVDKELDMRHKRFLLVVFSIGLVLSHYSLAYLFLFLALATFSFSSFFKGVKNERLITGKFILGYTLATFSWYIYAVPAASKTLIDDFNLIYNNLISQNPVGPGATGLMPPAVSVFRQVSQYQFYLLQLFIIVGFAVLIIMRRKSQFNPGYAGMAVGGLLLLLMSLVFPSFAATLNMTRIYHLSLFLLAPFCALGCMSILGLIANMKSLSRFSWRNFGKVTPRVNRAGMLLIALLLISLFLFQVGFIYKIIGDNNTGSISLSMDRMNSWTVYMNQLYVDQPEVSGLQWFAKYENNGSQVFADQQGTRYLMSYGSLPQGRTDVPGPDTAAFRVDSAYFFLYRVNVVDNAFSGWDRTYNTTTLTHLINETDQVYCNGANVFYCGHSVGVVSTP